MESKFSKLRPNYKVWLETDENIGVLGDGKWKLLKVIDETSSFKHAVEKLGLSYRKTWNNIKQIEEILGFPLLISTRGGSDFGNTYLTDDAKRIIRAFEAFHKEFDDKIQSAMNLFINELNKE